MVPQRCLVFKCGGRSSSAAIVLVTGGMVSLQNVVTKPIGGDIVTELVVELLAQEFKRKHRVDPRETKRGRYMIAHAQNLEFMNL